MGEVKEATINRPWAMKCKGCEADLSVLPRLNLCIAYGRLAVQCPTCDYYNFAMIDDQGCIEFMDY